MVFGEPFSEINADLIRVIAFSIRSPCHPSGIEVKLITRAEVAMATAACVLLRLQRVHRFDEW